jgi:alpha-tubulin suppressor-like RCC1 family protein
VTRRPLFVALTAISLTVACSESGQVLAPAPEATSSTPPPATKAASRVATGFEFSCALLLDGSAHCWGANQNGQLGNGDQTDQLSPVKVDSSERFVDLCAGREHACATSDRGEVWCWGSNHRGQLGQGNRTSLSRPARVALGGAPTQLACGFDHNCALLGGGELWCWGKNGEGELAQGDDYPGDANVESVDAPSPVRLGNGSFRSVGLGDGHSCAVRSDGSLWCSGRNTERQLGPASASGQERTLLQIGSDSDWQQVLAGMQQSCGLRTDRSLWCWGTNTGLESNEGFALGVPGIQVVNPTRVSGGGWLAVATDTFHTCAIAVNGGALWCWGRNAEGQLGSPDESLREAPTPIARQVISVDVNRFTTCIVDTAGVIACSGRNDRGQLGSGGTERPRAFVDVVIGEDD